MVNVSRAESTVVLSISSSMEKANCTDELRLG